MATTKPDRRRVLCYGEQIPCCVGTLQYVLIASPKNCTSVEILSTDIFVSSFTKELHDGALRRRSPDILYV
jgi:hypothetical protein